MDRATKEKALWLLGQKADGAGITYSEIALETGYSKQQLIRLSHSLEESGEAAALAHGNSVSRPPQCGEAGGDRLSPEAQGAISECDDRPF